jgi:hypothetical protein
MAKKKNSFLMALENVDLSKIDMKGVALGGDYSSVNVKEQDNKPNEAQNVDSKQSKPKSGTLVSTKENKALKSQKKQIEQIPAEPKPRPVRLKATLLTLRPTIKTTSQDATLQVSLEFLQSMEYSAQIEYLATNGWSLHLERYQGVHYEVAQKFFAGKKCRIYLKALQGTPNYQDYAKTDMLQVQNMMSLLEKKIYLFRRGWSVKVVMRSHQQYEYAVRYFNRKKKMIYLGRFGDEPNRVFLT